MDTEESVIWELSSGLNHLSEASKIWPLPGVLNHEARQGKNDSLGPLWASSLPRAAPGQNRIESSLKDMQRLFWKFRERAEEALCGHHESTLAASLAIVSTAG